jgi:hypothetical protein
MSRAREFAFDALLQAVVRVKASSEGKARDALADVLEAMDMGEETLDGYNSAVKKRHIVVTEVSLSQTRVPKLFEIDGIDAAEVAPAVPPLKRLIAAVWDTLAWIADEEDSVKEEHADRIAELTSALEAYVRSESAS